MVDATVGPRPERAPVHPYRLEEVVPAVEEYCALRLAAGLSERAPEAAAIGLPATLFAVSIRVGDDLVAMGRVVGDGGCNLSVVDIAVHPDHQRRGLGRRVMTSLMDRVRAGTPASAYVDLIADGGSPVLYAEFGFAFTAPASVAMAQML
jgi:ribosomal protein S18 acetylase RimI-like enzyme